MKVRAAAALLGLALSAAALFPMLLASRVPARGDLADFFWPMKAYTAERWRAGAPPLWNPLSGLGEPWLAQLQTGVFYPGDAPFLLPWPLGPHVAIALHLVIAATGMAAWLSALGRSRLAALSGAAVFAAGGAFLSLVPVYNNFATAAFLPWIFLGALRAARGGGIATFAGASALAFLAGEPALAAGGALAAAAAALAEGRPSGGTSSWRAAARLVAGVLLAAGLVSAVALPFAVQLRRSGRLAGTTQAEALRRPVGVSDLVDLVVPPNEEMTRAGGAGRGSYLVTLALGPLPLVLAAAGALGLSDRRFALVLLGLAAAGLLLALGERGGLAPLLVGAGPLRGTRFPARWFSMTHLVLSALAGAGIDTLRVSLPARRRALAIGATVVLGAFSLLALLEPARLRGGGALRAATALVSAAVGIGLLVRRPSAEAAFLAVLAGPLLWFSSDALASVPAAELVRTPSVLAGRTGAPAGRFFVAVHDGPLLSRWLAEGGRRFSEETVRRLHDALAGYGNLPLGLATAGTASPLDDPRRARLLGAALAGGNPRTLLALADVRELVTPLPTTIPGAELEAASGGVLRYRLPSGMGRVFFPREARVESDDAAFEALRRKDFDPEETAFLDSSPVPLPPRRTIRGFALARVLEDEPERAEMAISVSEGGLVVLTRSFDPGWRIRIDGLPVTSLRVDLGFLGALVPGGEHRLSLSYEPPLYRPGLAISGASLLVFAALLLAGRRPFRSRP
jgi:hypothetical protein